MDSYLAFLIFLCFVFLVFAFVQFLSSTIKNKIFGYRYSPIKLEPYESGMAYRDTAYKKYGIRVFPFLLLFLLFDIEAVILLPFVIEAKKFGLFAALELVLFVFILFMGYLFVLKNRGLDF
ncbi:MAG: NADH-quinone oxidoreductase subunit A [Candidatus Hydrothermales bacterium]